MKQLQKDKRGFSLVELIVVIAIIGALTLIAAGSMASVSSMRSRKAANITSAMVDQCKVNNLSGRQSTLRLFYNAGDKCYQAQLLDSDGTVYKTETIGEAKHIGLTVTVSGITTDVSGSDVTIGFSMETGAVTALSAASGNWDFARLNIVSGFGRTITLTRITGFTELS